EKSFRLVSLRETDWILEPLFSADVGFTHPSRSITRTCLPDTTEAACRAQTVNVLREEETWEPFTLPCDACDGAPALYQRRQTLTSASLTQAVGDRRAFLDDEVRYGDAATLDYRILPIFMQLEELTRDDPGGFTIWTPAHREETQYNAAGLPEETTAWMDDLTPATTFRDFDAAANLIAIYKPEQYDFILDRASPRTTFIYDSHFLYVATTINELGHLVGTTFDVATGAQLSRLGPNSVEGDLPCGPSTCRNVVFDAEIWTVDGFGRMKTHFVSVDHPERGYDRHVVDRVDYLDLTIPNQVFEHHLRDFGGSTWLTTIRDYDGAGRVTRAEQERFLSAAPNAVTNYVYDGAGNLVEIHTPDPRSDAAGATVLFSFAHDSLGRPRRFERPDGGGMTVEYRGLETLLTERATDGSGGTTRQRTDVHGRLVEVEDGVGTVGAITRYSFDANDNPKEVHDADGHSTFLSHDWVGNRTSITRGARVWVYRYDRNGNLVEDVSPAPAGLEAAFATTYLHDDLDRMIQKTPAPRELAPARLADLGIGPITYLYDLGARNAIGRLSRVDLPFATVGYDYEARGLVSREERTVSTPYLAGLAPTTQHVTRVYNALGSLTESTWDDGQTWRTTYDERGLPSVIDWLPSGATTPQTVAAYTRSVAGPPRSRAAFGQQRAWSYDAVGRPVADTIAALAGGIPTVHAARGYTFSQSGDLASVTGHTSGASVAASYTFDALHRLLTADGPARYDATFTYSDSGNLLTATVPAREGEARARTVTYLYGATDPQAVDRLRRPDGSDFARYLYDLAGNATERHTSDGDFFLTWDGDDQLREVVKAADREAYFYDHTGQRMLAVTDNRVRVWFAESETHFNKADHEVRRYLHLADSGGPVARVKNGDTLELQYADALQNLMLALDTAGTPVATFVYSPFGEVLGASGANQHRRQFNGKETDEISGLRYYGARFYDPVNLRWLSGDPLFRFAPDAGLGAPQQQNLYTFALNNPLRFFDPDGRGVDTHFGAGWITGLFRGLTPGGNLLPLEDSLLEDPSFVRGLGYGQIVGGLLLAAAAAGAGAVGR
ncbi:MAG: RHS repeat domain-containing protein, partial [Candidatus Rokuibacteriota bacterium]